MKNALYAAAEEMKIVLAKTAYSPLLKVAGDYSCGIFDARGNMVAQGPDLPIHLGSMPAHLPSGSPCTGLRGCCGCRSRGWARDGRTTGS